MTPSVKNGVNVPTLEMGDRVRLKKRLEEYVTKPISRKAVGIVADVQVSAISGEVAYTVVFSKENQAPTLWAHELVKIAKPAAKLEAACSCSPPPKLPADVK